MIYGNLISGNEIVQIALSQVDNVGGKKDYIPKEGDIIFFDWKEKDT